MEITAEIVYYTLGVIHNFIPHIAIAAFIEHRFN